MRAEKLVKKARKAKLLESIEKSQLNEKKLGEELFRLAEYAQSKGWSAEDLLRTELNKREKQWRKAERQKKEPV